MNNNITRKECQQTSEKIMEKIKKIKDDINEIKIQLAALPEKIRENFEDQYVSQDSFRPVRAVAYGLVGAITTGVVVAILASILK